MNLDLLHYDDSPTQTKLRTRIFETAFELFVKKGIAATSALEIAESIGISRRTLYNYYANKELLAEDLQILVLDRIHWFKGFQDFKPDQLSQYATAFGERLLKNHLPELHYINQFDHFFYENYPSDRYLKYLGSQMQYVPPMFLSMEVSLISAQLQICLGFAQRLALRLEPSQPCPDALMTEWRGFVATLFNESKP